MSLHLVPALGEVVAGKYRVTGVLGAGGMGSVLEATHVGLDQRVAIKLLNPQIAGSADVLERFVREARAAAQLSSEHVVRVSDVGVTELGAPYLVMDRLEGRDLAKELEERRTLPIPEAIDLVLQACEGLAEAHAAGLVHRDLKPANLFLARRASRRPVLKVLDFGLAKAPPTGPGAASLTGADEVFGTPQYMSPEQLESTKHVDARCDQHALGMILYEMLVGAPPYSAQLVTEIVIRIATHPVPSARSLRPDVPPALDHAIRRAMAKRPEGRFLDLREFAVALAPFADADSQRHVQNITAALAATDHAPTLRAQAARPVTPAARAAEGSGADLTSTSDPVSTRARQRRVALLGAMVSLVVGGASYFIARPASGPEPPRSTGATLSAASRVEESAPILPGGSVTAFSSDSSAPAPSSVATAGSASGTSGRSASAPREGPAPGAPTSRTGAPPPVAKPSAGAPPTKVWERRDP